MKRFFLAIAFVLTFAMAQGDLPKIEGGPITKVAVAEVINWGRANAERLGAWILRKDKISCASVEVYSAGYGILDIERLHATLPGAATLLTGESSAYKVISATYPNGNQYVIVFAVGGPLSNPSLTRCTVKK